jgi:hypothetical protein
MNFIGLMLHWLNFFWTVYNAAAQANLPILSAPPKTAQHLRMRKRQNGRFEHFSTLPPFTNATKQSTYEIKEYQTYFNPPDVMADSSLTKIQLTI